MISVQVPTDWQLPLLLCCFNPITRLMILLLLLLNTDHNALMSLPVGTGKAGRGVKGQVYRKRGVVSVMIQISVIKAAERLWYGRHEDTDRRRRRGLIRQTEQVPDDVREYDGTMIKWKKKMTHRTEQNWMIWYHVTNVHISKYSDSDEDEVIYCMSVKIRGRTPSKLYN